MDFLTSLSEVTYSVVDIETSGMKLESSHIIEIAAVQIKPGYIVDMQNAFSSLINPLAPIAEETTLIHGITDSMVKTAPKAGAVMKEFSNFVKKTVIVAHNASFDIKYIKKTLKEENLPSPILYVLDSVEISRKVNKHLKSHSLDSLINYYGITSPRTTTHRHRALYDADTTAIILCKMFEQLEDMGIFTLGDIFQ